MMTDIVLSSSLLPKVRLGQKEKHPMRKNSVMFVTGFGLATAAAAAIWLASVALAGSKGGGPSVVKQTDKSSPIVIQKSTNKARTKGVEAITVKQK